MTLCQLGSILLFGLLKKERQMGKHLDKLQRALAQRQAASYAPGQKKPGSMNIKKTGYRGQRAKGSK